ncbi:MAG: glycoside hydrolase family 3 N-terminal domain-containing protein [Pseudomonadota bacterium]
MLRTAGALAGAVFVAWAMIVIAGGAAVAAQEDGGEAATPKVIRQGKAANVPLPQVKPVRAESSAPAPSTCQPADDAALWASLPATLRDVPLRKMIGQLLVVSYTGTTPGARGVADTVKALRRSEISGVLTFRHNIKSASATRQINALFRDANPVLPALIAVDQEGGAVMRVKPSEGAPKTPSAKRIGQGSVAAAEKAYGGMARALADLGFTVNFGPVVDLAVNPNNPVIAKFGRAYGKDPAKVSAFAGAFVRAHRAAGVATSVKHFPGHGSSTADSHDGAIDITPTWRESELLPFQNLIADGLADMIMIGHLELSGLTGPGDLPASLSPIAITDVLRNRLCFTGLVVSDDLAMSAIENHWGSPEAARLMIEAGGDLALVSLPSGKGLKLVAEITDYLVEAAETSDAFAEKIRRAYARVVAHKLGQAPPQPKGEASEGVTIAAE